MCVWLLNLILGGVGFILLIIQKRKKNVDVGWGMNYFRGLQVSLWLVGKGREIGGDTVRQKG
jgi:hypothetical protein